MSVDLHGDLVRELVVGGVGLQDNVAAKAVEWNLVMNVGEVTELSVTLEDPGLSLLRQSPLPFGARPFRLGAPVEWRDLKLVIAALQVDAGKAQEQLKVDCRAAGVQVLRHEKGPKVWSDVAPHELVREECAKVGLAFFGEETTQRRPSIARSMSTTPTFTASLDLLTVTRVMKSDTASEESTWQVFERLAGELGFILFEAAGTVVFGRPSWLVARGGLNARPHRWRWPRADGDRLEENEDRLLDVPSCRQSQDAEQVTITARLHVEDALSYRPGDAVMFAGVPGFEGLFVVTAIDVDPGEPLASITAGTPVDPAITATATGVVMPSDTPPPIGGDYGYQYDEATRLATSDPHLPGSEALMAFVLATFPGTSNLGIWVPRNVRGSATALSVHAEGRACDFGVPLAGALGDRLAAWFVDNAARIGIQQVIWNRRSWNSERRTWIAYHGVNLHTDHVHAELCWAAARSLTRAQLQGDPATVAGAPSAPSALASIQLDAKTQAAAKGWVGAEWDALFEIVRRESSWRPTAQNPGSTAYGLFQFLDETWATVGATKTSDPHAQIVAGLQYVSQRYVTPRNALAFHNRIGWY